MRAQKKKCWPRDCLVLLRTSTKLYTPVGTRCIELISDLTHREDELGGKTLLIIGLGGIGSRLAQLAKAFGMRVIGIKRDPSKGGEAADSVHRLADLRAILPQADFIALTCPLTKETEKVIDADQDILNLCLEGDWTALPYYWNVISPFFVHMHDLGLPESETAAIRRDARIIHFNGMSKPWSYMSRHPRRAEYWKYLRLTEWRDYTPSDRSTLNWAKKYFGPFIPEAVRARLQRG